jgi:hypothetical protein
MLISSASFMRFAERAVIGDRRRVPEGTSHHVANATANPDSRDETNPSESCSLLCRRSFLPSCLRCASFLLIKKKKGGEQMKIKVHVRAGGPAKSRA